MVVKRKESAQHAVTFWNGAKRRGAGVRTAAAEIPALLDDGPDERIPTLPDPLGFLLHQPGDHLGHRTEHAAKGISPWSIAVAESSMQRSIIVVSMADRSPSNPFDFAIIQLAQ